MMDARCSRSTDAPIIGRTRRAGGGGRKSSASESSGGRKAICETLEKKQERGRKSLVPCHMGQNEASTIRAGPTGGLG